MARVYDSVVDPGFAHVVSPGGANNHKFRACDIASLNKLPAFVLVCNCHLTPTADVAFHFPPECTQVMTICKAVGSAARRYRRSVALDSPYCMPIERLSLYYPTSSDMRLLGHAFSINATSLPMLYWKILLIPRCVSLGLSICARSLSASLMCLQAPRPMLTELRVLFRRSSRVAATPCAREPIHM